MEILVSTIDTGSGSDYTSFLTWESGLEYKQETYNVGVIGDSSSFDEEYSSFTKLIERKSIIGDFVLMTKSGLILASSIAEHSKISHSKIPKPTPSVESQDYEDIARTYIKRTIDELDRSISRSEAELILKTTSEKLAELIAQKPEQLNYIEWRDVERMLTEVFNGIGFNAELTSAGKDGGKDIILECTTPSGRRTYYVEIKHWRSEQKVGKFSLLQSVQFLFS